MTGAVTTGRGVLAAAAALLLSAGAIAAPATCDDAARAAEAAWRLPPGLMSAIGRVEAGRWDAATRKVVAWPWAIDAGGRDYYSASLPEAIALVQSLQSQGTRSIDVGCFQVNLFYHPEAFADLAAAFDPMTNGQQAGRFLASLHDRSGDWRSAVGQYHSASPGEGELYRQRVYLSLNGGEGGMGPAGAPPPSLFDAVVVMMSPAAARVRVYGPPSMDADAQPGGLVRRRRAGGLPVVFTPAAGPG